MASIQISTKEMANTCATFGKFSEIKYLPGNRMKYQDVKTDIDPVIHKCNNINSLHHMVR